MEKKEITKTVRELHNTIESMELRAGHVAARLEARIAQARTARAERVASTTETFPPPGSLLDRYWTTLGNLELRVIEVAERVSEALVRHGEENIFDLIATVNSLLGMVERLHAHAEMVRLHTQRALGIRAVGLEKPIEVHPDILLGIQDSQTPPD